MQQTIPPVLAMLAPAVCALLLLMAAARDLASRTIPNRVPLLLTVIGCVVQGVSGDLLPALGVAAAMFAACTLAWRFGMMGGGDVKLLAALSLCVPPAAVFVLILSVSLAGGVLGLAYLLLRGRTGRDLAPARRGAPMAARVLRAERWRIGRGAPLPYGIAIAAGGLITLF